ncbi:hypothetical protein DLS38_13665 [Staphylococcus pseudintermedius]|nr:hypothetical protein DLS38_13665 [Staphylococcus pseudintermedius]
MFLQGISISSSPKITHVPELINTLWQDRCDIVVPMGREYIRRYDILHFLSAGGDVVTDTPITQPWQTAGVFDYTFDATFQ